MVSVKGDDKEGVNELNIRIWVEGDVLEYEPRCVAKTSGGSLTMYRPARGATRCRYERKSCVGNSMREMF